MAKLIYTTAAAFFLLFAFSHALTSDVVDEKLPLSDTVEVKEAVNALRLPSERSGFETEPEVQIGTFELKDEKEPDESTTTEAVPLTFVNFRPAGRPYPLGHRRGCRHGRRVGKWGPRFHELEKDDAPRKTVTYGNDMITGGDEMKFDRHFRGGERQIPARWTGFRHVGLRFAHKHDDDEHHEMEPVRPHRHNGRHRHHDHDKDENENENEEEHHHGHHHGHGHGLFRSIRKFLNGF